MGIVINKIVVCPICKKKTFLRIQDAGYLDEYPIHINCYNCRALLKGKYIMGNQNELFMYNADIEDCDLDQHTLTCKNADYVAEVSGELPCEYVKKYEGGLPKSPFMKAVDNLTSVVDRKSRLSIFNDNMREWKKRKSTAFQLLDDGSIEYISTALDNKMGEYYYECDHYLKSIHCLQEVMLEQTNSLYINQSQDNFVHDVISALSAIDSDALQSFVNEIGGVSGLFRSYRKAVEVFSEFMNIYANLLPAESYMYYKNCDTINMCLSTCSFGDIKSFYQDAYESLLSLLYIPIGLDNIVHRGDFQKFSSIYDDVYPKNGFRNINWYRGLDNGTRFNKINDTELFQKKIDFPANRWLRNGIGHNNIKYDSLKQEIVAYDFKNANKIKFQGSLMSVALDCLRLVKSSITYTEIILFLLRKEFKQQGIHSIMHPRFYKRVQVNDRCPCGSGLKYKHCCRNEVELVVRN